MKSLFTRVAFVVMFMAAALSVSAQTRTNATGVVVDNSSKEPIIGATVIALNTNIGAITDENGKFELSNLKVGTEYEIEVSFVGYTEQTMTIKAVKGGYKFSSDIKLKADKLQVDETVVQADAPVTIQLGDTTQYNAGAYKTNPDATAEDLVAKMPGFSVSDSGITVDGESVAQIYVDGKAYFKDDPMTALSSLPADAIESIQQFDEKSDQSRMSGFDDGDRTKTLNIVTKAKRKQDYFGDFIAGYGTEGRYNVKSTANIFQEKHRFTIGFGLNNINQSSVSGGSRFYGSRTVSGIQESNGLKLNYTGDYKKSEFKYTELGVNYVFTNTQNNLEQTLAQNYFANSSEGYDERSYDEDEFNNSRSNRHSLRLDLETSINEENMIYFRTWGSITNTASNVLSAYDNILDGVLTNTADTKTYNDGESINAGGNLTWMHKFNDKRTGTINFNGSYSESVSDQFLVGNIASLQSGVLTDSLVDQESNTLTNSASLGAKATLTQKLNKSSALIFNYNLKYNKSTTDKKTYVYDPTTGQYLDLDESLSNELARDYVTNSAGLGYSLSKNGNLNFNIGADFQNAQLQNNQLFPDVTSRDYNFNSVVTYLRFDYSIDKNKRLMARMNGSPDLPSMTQLQDVVDNSNLLQISTGNPNLDQAYGLRFMTSYFASNPEKSTSLRLFLFGNSSFNSIVSNTRFLTEDEYINGVYVQNGAQVSTYANGGSSWNTYTGADYTFPIRAIKSNMNTSLAYSYSKTPSIYNGVDSYSTNNGVTFRASVSSNISQNVDFTVSSNTSYTAANSTISSASSSKYLTESLGVKFNWIFLRSFVFNTDYTYNYYYYSTGGFDDPNFHLLNMGLGRKFLRNQAELRVSAYDLLGQNKGYSRTVSSLYIQDSNTNVLSRYFMLSFSFKFNTMQNMNKYKNIGGDDRREGPPSGGPGGGGPGGPPRTY